MDFSKYTKRRPSSCESCEFYDYDEYTDSYCCSLSLDEDEAREVMEFGARDCKYYRFFDEYKSVNRQI